MRLPGTGLSLVGTQLLRVARVAGTSARPTAPPGPAQVHARPVFTLTLQPSAKPSQIPPLPSAHHGRPWSSRRCLPPGSGQPHLWSPCRGPGPHNLDTASRSPPAPASGPRGLTRCHPARSSPASQAFSRPHVLCASRVSSCLTFESTCCGCSSQLGTRLSKPFGPAHRMGHAPIPTPTWRFQPAPLPWTHRVRVPVGKPRPGAAAGPGRGPGQHRAVSALFARPGTHAPPGWPAPAPAGPRRGHSPARAAQGSSEQGPEDETDAKAQAQAAQRRGPLLSCGQVRDDHLGSWR